MANERVRGITCSKCGNAVSDVIDVIDSRGTNDDAIRRRRQCLACGHRFTTYERIDDETPPRLPDVGSVWRCHRYGVGIVGSSDSVAVSTTWTDGETRVFSAEDFAGLNAVRLVEEE
jgi:DNA-directed RNA polymerase subunit RPC12/RpoP